MSITPSPSVSTSLKHEFDEKLKHECTKACICGVHDFHPCPCPTSFINTEPLLEWMLTIRGDGKSNAERLLDEVAPSRPNFVQPESIFRGEKTSILVFSILLMESRGELIYHFYSAGVFDKDLENEGWPWSSNDSLEEDLRTELQSDRKFESQSQSVEKIIDEFKKDARIFCPARLELNMTRHFPPKKILPFFERKKVNNKGGTASVYYVTIQENYLCEDIKKALENRSFLSDEYGKYYELAIKSYTQGQKMTYDWEKKALRGLSKEEDMVKYFGCYSYKDGGRQTYNLILELGDMDLAEYFRQQNPPELGVDIVETWKWMSTIVRSIQKIHKFSHDTGEYDGWHGDVKPDNILVVGDKLKLADFGFCEFISSNGKLEKSPTAEMRGGTDTYGAPECAQAKSRKGKLAVTQAIDLWSFGCVLSCIATWVVLGQKGMEDFSMLRRRAHKQRDPRAVTDAFHDGNELLPEIKGWHQYLKIVTKKSDIVTSDILDLVETKLLLANHTDRQTSKWLTQELSLIINRAKRSETILEESRKIIPAIQDIMKQQLLTAAQYRDRREIGSAGTSAENILRPNPSNHPRKSKRISRSTSHREKTLEQVFSSQVFNTTLESRDENNPPLRSPSSKGKGKERAPPETDHNHSIPFYDWHRTDDSLQGGTKAAARPDFDGIESRDEDDGPFRSNTSKEKERAFSKFDHYSRSALCNSHSTSDSLQDGTEAALIPKVDATKPRYEGDMTLRTPFQANLETNRLHPPPNITSLPITPKISPPHPPPPQPPSNTPGNSSTIPSQLPGRPAPLPNNKITSAPPGFVTHPEDIWSIAGDPQDEVKQNTCKSILKERPDTAKLTDKNECTPIMIAAQKHNMGIVSILCTYSPLQHKDTEGKTVLHHMILGQRPLYNHCKNDPKFVNTLKQILNRAKEEKIDIINMIDGGKYSALYYCLTTHTVETAKILIKTGAMHHPPGGSDIFRRAMVEQDENMVKLFLDSKDLKPPLTFDMKNLPKTSKVVLNLLKDNRKGQKASQPGPSKEKKPSGFLGSWRS
ncbi:hypothetical protein B0J14DRAFT_700840 [Halenospora varia]|nr:hypothetical protein B0J14DRAFT_700840 [Halenospora varia]